MTDRQETIKYLKANKVLATYIIYTDFNNIATNKLDDNQLINIKNKIEEIKDIAADNCNYLLTK